MRIGAYEVLRELGRGGMGTVVLARSATGESVAIKLLSKDEPDAVARFERERRLLGGFTARDGFVPLLDGGTSEQGPYLVMPFVAGGTLRARLAAGPLSADETLALGLAVARAIGLAHERGVVHRDLKPENILFAADGKPLVADLGIAKHFTRAVPGGSQSATLTRDGAVRGTIRYMAKEQLEGDAPVGPPADVFALGAILYECLTGEPAFHGETVYATIGAIANGRFEPILARRPSTPGWLAEAIEKTLVPDAAKRPADGFAFRRALEQGASGGRRSRAPLLVAVGLLAVSGVAAAFFAPSVRPERAPAPPVRPERAPPPSGAASRGTAAPVGSSSGEARAPDEPWRALYAHARQRIAAGDVVGGRADLEQSLALHPSPEAWTALADVKLAAGDIAGALAGYDEAIALDRTFAIAWANRGAAKASRSDAAGALADCDQALALDPKQPNCLSTRGASKFVLGDLDGALADADAALRLDPKCATAWATRGTYASHFQDWDAAIRAYDRAIELDPEGRTVCYVARAFARLSNGDRAGAVADCEKVLALEAPAIQKAEAYRGRATARMLDQRFDLALPDLERALDVCPEDAVAWLDRGSCKAELHDRDGALADWKHYLEIAKDPRAMARARALIARLEAPPR